jgi:RNA polymerase sigma-54 factor
VSVKLSLQAKLSQSLALTPQLQQSIRLLQLSTLELNQELEQVLLDNPLLERLDDPLDNCVRLDASGGLDSQTTSAPSVDGGMDSNQQSDEPRSESGSSEGEIEFSRDADQEAYEGDNFEADFGSDVKSNTSKSDEDEREFQQLDAAESTLREHLLGQLSGSRLSQRDKALITILIEELTEAGYLETSLEEVLSILPDELEIEIEELATALKLLQNFDPCSGRNFLATFNNKVRPAWLGCSLINTSTCLPPATLQKSSAIPAAQTKNYAMLKRLFVHLTPSQGRVLVSQNPPMLYLT